MIYNIPEWPKDSDLEHYATTWILARDKDFNNVEEKVEKSEDYLLAWEVKTVIPTGEVWYIKALRHLRDKDGNDIDNKKWIGPKPVFNEESNKNDYIAPKFYIEQPYILDIEYIPNEKLKLKVTPYESNIAFVNAMLTIEDANKILLTKFVDINETKNKIEITKDELDFTTLNYLKLTLVYIGNHSTISEPFVEEIMLKKIFYRITGNIRNLDPTKENTFKIESTSGTGVKVTKAILTKINGEKISDCVISNNYITVPAVLDFKSSYKVMTTITYRDKNGNDQTIVEPIMITTMKPEEKQHIYPDRVYSYEDLPIVKKLSDDEKNRDNINTITPFNTEEFYSFVTPILNNDGKIDMRAIHKDDLSFFTSNNNVLDLDKPFAIRLLNQKYGIIQTRDDHGLLVLQKFEYDQYKDKLILIDNPINTSLKIMNPVGIKIAELADGYYIAGVNKDDAKEVIIYKLDLNGFNLEKVYSFKYDNELDDILVTTLDNFELIITPISDQEFRMRVYSTNDNYENKSVSVPDGFVGKQLINTRLQNGDIAFFKLNDTDKPLNYFYIDVSKQKVETVEIGTKENIVINNIVEFKNGDRLFIIDNEGDIKFRMLK